MFKNPPKHPHLYFLSLALLLTVILPLIWLIIGSNPAQLAYRIGVKADGFGFAHLWQIVVVPMAIAALTAWVWFKRGGDIPDKRRRTKWAAIWAVIATGISLFIYSLLEFAKLFAIAKAAQFVANNIEANKITVIVFKRSFSGYSDWIFGAGVQMTIVWLIANLVLYGFAAHVLVPKIGATMGVGKMGTGDAPKSS